MRMSYGFKTHGRILRWANLFTVRVWLLIERKPIQKSINWLIISYVFLSGHDKSNGVFECKYYGIHCLAVFCHSRACRICNIIIITTYVAHSASKSEIGLHCCFFLSMLLSLKDNVHLFVKETLRVFSTPLITLGQHDLYVSPIVETVNVGRSLCSQSKIFPSYTPTITVADKVRELSSAKVLIFRISRDLVSAWFSFWFFTFQLYSIFWLNSESNILIMSSSSEYVLCTLEDEILLHEKIVPTKRPSIKNLWQQNI